MSHYFTNDDIRSNEKEVEIKINDIDFKFITDNGVFSKRGLDFGTRTLLENLDIDSIKGNVLDFGCGWGPIGIYIAKRKNILVDMIDINKRSLELAFKNASLNNVNVNIFESNIYQKIDKKYDFIVTNPPIRVGKKTLYEILFGAYDYLKTNGQLWLVVHKDQGAKSLVKDLSEKYKTEIICKNKGFYIIKAEKC